MKKLCLILLLSIFWVCSPALAQDQITQAYTAANTFYAQSNYDAAITNYQTVVQANPNLWQAYQGLGNCYYAKGDTATALTNYQKALQLNPNNTQLAQFVQSLQPTPVPTPIVGLPSAPVASTNTVASTASTPTTANRGMAADRNLPKEGKFVIELEDSDWVGGWGDLQKYYNNSIAVTDSVFGIKLGAGGAFAISPNFQLGAKVQFLTKTEQDITGSGLAIAYDESAVGGALEAEGTFPMGDGVNFLTSAQAGVYTLVGSNITVTGLVNGTASFASTAPGFMISAGFEFLMNPQKTWALDLGLNYQYLQFSPLTDTPQGGTPFTLKNSDGSNAYFDFSGVGLSLGARFF